VAETTSGLAVRYQGDFTREELRGRRDRVGAAIGGDAGALVPAAPRHASSDVFRQANDFYYLCGVETPHAYLLVVGNRSTLFLPPQGRQRRDMEGEILSADDPDLAARLTGVDEVLGVQLLASHLHRLKTVYVPQRGAEVAATSWDSLQRADDDVVSDPWDGRPGRAAWFRGLLAGRFPHLEVRDLCPVLNGLRIVKSPREVDLLRRSGSLAARGLVEAMRGTRPGMMEYQLAAAAEYHFNAGGAHGSSYRPIVAGGPNAWYGHYGYDDCPLRDGDLVLMDCGPDYRYYASDITRMWPVNGTYTPVQRELYGFIVKYHQVLLRFIRAGVTEVQIRDEAARAMEPVIEKTAFSKPIYEQAARRTLVFAHLTHSVGMAVHDVGHYKGAVIEPGVVFALDPQLIIPEERLYIRVEDTVAVTETGVENLTGDAPLELDEVERTMRDEGVLQRFPPLP